MKSAVFRPRVPGSLVLVAALTAALGLMAWAAAAGPVTVYRIIVHNTSTVRDHLKFPVCTLAAAPNPAAWRRT